MISFWESVRLDYVAYMFLGNSGALNVIRHAYCESREYQGLAQLSSLAGSLVLNSLFIDQFMSSEVIIDIGIWIHLPI